MMGPTHRLLGACAGVAVAAHEHLGPAPAAVSVALAVLTSAGATSPDVDQSRAWHISDHVLPDELLGSGGPMQHRGLTHWWGVPAAMGVTTYLFLPRGLWWLVAATLAGWASHLLGDLFFGRADVRGGRGPGIPTAPWWGHVGFGLDVDGALERVVVQRIALPCLLAWQALDAFGLAHPLWQRLGRAVTVAWSG